MKKIYDKKGFRSGLFFLLLAILGTIATILKFDSLNTIRLIKNIVIDTLLYLIGINSIFKSYSYIDSEDNDERSELVKLKAQSSSFMICFYICFTLNVLLVLGYAITKSEELLYLYIPLGIMSGIMFITIILTSFYYDKKC